MNKLIVIAAILGLALLTSAILIQPEHLQAHASIQPVYALNDTPPSILSVVTDKDDGTLQRIINNGYAMWVYVTIVQGSPVVNPVDVYVYFGSTTVLFGSLPSQTLFTSGFTTVAVLCTASGGSLNPAWYYPLPLTVTVTGPGGSPLYNTYSNPALTVEVTGPGDILGGHRVTMSDVIQALMAFGTYRVVPPPPPQPPVNAPVTMTWLPASRAYPDANVVGPMPSLPGYSVNMGDVVFILENFAHVY
jgi:hypothetical protein